MAPAYPFFNVGLFCWKPIASAQMPPKFGSGDTAARHDAIVGFSGASESADAQEPALRTRAARTLRDRSTPLRRHPGQVARRVRYSRRRQGYKLSAAPVLCAARSLAERRLAGACQFRQDRTRLARAD